ncbi:D-aminoacyl-tRNA deacylase-like isoform X1 [Syzygium oleosum]|uniref:D-aminoacyl-tRNA deacylase-like isoform X1 n=1 Tax=Syzygium oleosum TaxID=219896 RepID=UPI0024BA740F|nr:D-aminoacyl-tRNA deacylase-like isoform X1 [Syzygium oleosum]XP_056170652.1 D-aminoacyl-tRNA deacylase-like isoform X1 [Syzygium oleosum]XP_056170653.1 D-aminoacyl-tRNA deacylase-like isoform X1 [Syzygium oleosum]XP_056170654.1 D-aminoacyl-tRNA deacylase-like isoform X1 [Syzygium oleosum]XP_056170655.1 D-aminoacyl-tRNA deacylase-like isoform X1 [Syzygium oleosum]XP_056170656.1 D-aminoacyl-tRNA deacylase-like isoform X1 [Syzygium oleosum]
MLDFTTTSSRILSQGARILQGRPTSAARVRRRLEPARPPPAAAEMVTLVAATAADPASIGPASSLLAMPGWHPGPTVQGMPSFVNEKVRLLKLENHLVREDHLDKRWEEATGESVDEVIFLSRHVAASNRPALTIHPIGTPHLRQDEVPLAGGRPGWAAPPNPRIGPWLRLLKNIAESHKLVPEFEVTLEATHHGPEISSPTMFVEIGSTDEYWKRQDAAQAIALLVWEGLGLGGGNSVGDWSRKGDQPKVLLGIGGGHYVPRHMDIAWKDGVWVGHLLSGYSLPMEQPSDSKEVNSKGVAGTWREAIKIAFETTRLAFPGGEVLVHLDLKSFKSWQRNAVTEFLASEKIKIGKAGDFY